MVESQKLWILKSKGMKSSFGGNDGYDDLPDSYYVYDNYVPNYNKLQQGDYVLIADKKYLHGFAIIDEINITEGLQKKRYSCPICGIKEHSTRLYKIPRYKCRKGHEFDKPREELTDIQKYKASYRHNYIPLPEHTSVHLLEKYYINRNRYYSIQSANPSFLHEIFPNLLPKLTSHTDGRLKTLTLAPYEPSANDERKFRIGKTYHRPEQPKFRNDLFDFYGKRCMITGYTVSAALEASHICHFLGSKDNHPQNGLLLRRDLHALFDADLLGIDPQDMIIRISPLILNTEYAQYNGTALSFGQSSCSPSADALKIRWDIFLEKTYATDIAVR